ncbi:hypothetical protein HPB51_011431 [Rhipicephalus microplus]|uniref:CCHC-type domain-containing protein n=1 Tax=Rhipicephalus microplus TaxID=6941 RepID=A0A9J6EFY5_RHIMP|nr:hypothetical protein HPB51_011431 [Rhipicephalus microplus]
MSCGDIGHKQDVCPNTHDDLCDNCGEQNTDPKNYRCEPKCKLCGIPHETVSRDCLRKLKLAPPPLRFRERSRAKWRSSWYQNDIANMNDNHHVVPPAPQSPNEDKQKRMPRSKSRLKPRGRELGIPRTMPTDVEPDNVQGKLSGANVVTGHSQLSTETTVNPITTLSIYEDKLALRRRENEELRRALEVQEKRMQEKKSSKEKQLAYILCEK